MSSIKQGYKQTKVGIIPEDWEVKYIEDVAELKGGKRLPLGYELTELITPYPYIRVTNMSMGGLNDKQILYVPNNIQPKIKNYIISKDDLYIAVAGNTLGMVGAIPENLDGANLTENADKLCNIKMNKQFLLFVLMSDLIQNVIQNEITTNAQPKLALTRIKKFHIPFPSLEEQEKIAEILTTWDEAISLHVKLIEEKEQLKIGLMQKLLSGEVRFEGFCDVWEEVKLSKIIKLQGGYAFKSEEFKKSGIPIIRISNISNNSNYMEMSNLVYYDKVLNESNFLIKRGDLLIAMSGATTGKVSIVR